MRPDRAAQDDRYEEVHHPPAHRSHPETDKVVDVEPEKGSGRVSRDEILREEVAHDVRQAEPDEAGREVPETDVQRSLFRLDDRCVELDPDEDRTDDDEWVDPNRSLTPLHSLRLAHMEADPGAEDDQVPGSEDHSTEFPRGNPHSGQARYGPIQHREECVGEEPKRDQVGVNHPDASGRQHGDLRQRPALQELQRVEQAGDECDRHPSYRGGHVRFDERFARQRERQRSGFGHGLSAPCLVIQIAITFRPSRSPRPRVVVAGARRERM